MFERYFVGHKLKYLILCIVIACCIYVLNTSNSLKCYGFKSFVTHAIVNQSQKYQLLSYERDKIGKSVELIDLYLSDTYGDFNGSKSNSRLLYPNYFVNGTQIVINQRLCSNQFGSDLKLLVFVFNRVDSFERRKTIRNTWGYDLKSNPNSKMYFAVAMTANQTVQKMLDEENRIFGDIIQFNHYEYYLNCTIKALGLLRWTSLYCPFVRWILKTDDDSVLISNDMIQFAKTTKPDSIYGSIRIKSPPMRGSNAKWLISSEDYPNDTYPNYMAGPYLIPGQICLSLYKTALIQSLPALPFEDAYITGIVAERLNISRKHLENFIWFPQRRQQLQSCWLKNATIYFDKLNDNEISHLWMSYQNNTFC